MRTYKRVIVYFLSLRAHRANCVTCPCAVTEFRIVRLKYRVWHAFGTWICVCFTSCVWFNLWPIFVRRDFSGYINGKRAFMIPFYYNLVNGQNSSRHFSPAKAVAIDPENKIRPRAELTRVVLQATQVIDRKQSA